MQLAVCDSESVAIWPTFFPCDMEFTPYQDTVRICHDHRPVTAEVGIRHQYNHEFVLR